MNFKTRCSPIKNSLKLKDTGKLKAKDWKKISNRNVSYNKP